MIRTPKAGETWIWDACEFHRQLPDVVVEGCNFEDQPEFIQQHILGCLYCGCWHAADDPELAIRELRRYEEREKGRVLAKVESVVKVSIEHEKPRGRFLLGRLLKALWRH